MRRFGLFPVEGAHDERPRHGECGGRSRGSNARYRLGPYELRRGAGGPCHLLPLTQTLKPLDLSLQRLTPAQLARVHISSSEAISFSRPLWRFSGGQPHIMLSLGALTTAGMSPGFRNLPVFVVVFNHVRAMTLAPCGGFVNADLVVVNATSG